MISSSNSYPAAIRVSQLASSGRDTVPERSIATEEGKIPVAVLERQQTIVVIASMAGTDPENISLHLHNDLLTIRGQRFLPGAVEDDVYFYNECFWGEFSRTIVLPVDVKTESARAEYRHGVLVITFDKAKIDTSIPLIFVEE